MGDDDLVRRRTLDLLDKVPLPAQMLSPGGKLYLQAPVLIAGTLGEPSSP
jgi:hypothetical protein